ncbi:MAG: winged helix-turn-helix domain-containing protein [Ignavibacteria bacterium]|nr:winged helix-turn-helix domain-containing protein [Ignavibacteria bacterium]
MQQLSAEVQDAQRQIVELVHKFIRERLAEALLVLKETFGTIGDGMTLASPLTREEIASVVGTAPESVIRTLSEFKADKPIAINGRAIMLTNLKGLLGSRTCKTKFGKYDKCHSTRLRAVRDCMQRDFLITILKGVPMRSIPQQPTAALIAPILDQHEAQASRAYMLREMR